MGRFVQVDRETAYLLPLPVDEWLPGNHLARFVVEVIDQLDLSKLTGAYAGRGSAAHHPSVLLGLLVYGYATGVFSSRKIGRATYRAIALCSRFPEDQPGSVIIIERSQALATAEADLGRRVIVANDVQRHPPDQAQVFRRVVFPGLVGVLAELHVQHPVLAVFDGPMAPCRLGEALGVGERAQIIAAFGCGLAIDGTERLDPAHRGQARPTRP